MSKQKFKVQMQKMGAWVVVITPIDVKKVFGRKGHVRVKGTIDGYPFDDTSLMPMRTGEHCMAIRNEIRKAIRKGPNDTIEIILEEDFAELKIPEELLEAFEASPEAEKMFNAFPPSHKRNYTKYVAGSKNKATRERRAIASVFRLEKEYVEKGKVAEERAEKRARIAKK